MINIVCTSKPTDGLLYYSYEHCVYLNQIGVDTRLIIIPHPGVPNSDYIKAITAKYTIHDYIKFDYTLAVDDITLIMGRSMLTLGYYKYADYTKEQQVMIVELFSNKLISVYSENHPIDYHIALMHIESQEVIDLCDYDVYPNGIGDHFEKTINFSIHKPIVDDIQFKYLFLGTNDKYYATIDKVIDQYPDHGILTYDQDYVNNNNNNIFVPVENLMGMFDTYVYTKDTFDPAPRIFQECKYFGKKVIYLRDKTIQDGGSVYWKRDISEPDVTPILTAMEKFK